MTMLHNFETISHDKDELNPLTRLWCKLSTFSIFNHKLLKYIKLVKITKFLGILKMNIHSTLSPSWKISCKIIWTHLNLSTEFLGQNVCLFYNIFFMTKPLQMVGQIVLLYRCITDNNLLEVEGFFVVCKFGVYKLNKDCVEPLIYKVPFSYHACWIDFNIYFLNLWMHRVWTLWHCMSSRFNLSNQCFFP